MAAADLHLLAAKLDGPIAPTGEAIAKLAGLTRPPTEPTRTISSRTLWASKPNWLVTGGAAGRSIQMRVTGLEPARPFGHGNLNPARLPFRHTRPESHDRLA